MPTQKKRLFFALWPDQELCKVISERTHAVVENSGGRAIRPENLHITLAFLHNVETDLIPCIESAASRAAGQSFDLKLSRVGFWKRSRLLWLAPPVELSSETATPAGLAGALWRDLAVCGFTPEQRPFKPHVTLARKAITTGPIAPIATIHWPVSSFVLVESITGKRQSEYVVLKTFPLSAASGISR